MGAAPAAGRGGRQVAGRLLLRGGCGHGGGEAGSAKMSMVKAAGKVKRVVSPASYLRAGAVATGLIILS